MMQQLVRRSVTAAVLGVLSLFGRAKLPPIGTTPLQRITVFRFGGIGDMVATTGLIRSLRTLYPTARIAVATAPPFVPVLANNPDIDEVLVSFDIVPYRGVWPFLRAIRILRRWSDPPLDLAIFVHNFFYILFLAIFVRAQFKLGFDTNNRGFDFALTHSAPIYGAGHPKNPQHEARPIIEHFHDLLRALRGEPLPASAPRIVLSRPEAEEARARLEAHGLGRPLIVVAPGGSSTLKIWPIDRFATLSRRLLAERRASIAVLGGPGEAALSSRFAGMGPGLWFAAGALTLRQSMAIAEQADLVVGNDTGLVHAAAALHVPTIAVFGPTPSTVYGGRGPRNVILQSNLPCVPCRDDRICRLLPSDPCSGPPPCLDQVTVEAVFAAVDRQLAERHAPSKDRGQEAENKPR
jgi:heptosyltransferase-2